MLKRTVKATAFLAALPAVAGVMVLVWWIKRRQDLDVDDLTFKDVTHKDDYIEVPQESEVVELIDDSSEDTELDDLSRIEGIGPKISSVLRGVGITSFVQLAKTDVDKLVEYLRGASVGANPDTWPEQAGLAAKGEWEALKTFQEELSLSLAPPVRLAGTRRTGGLAPRLNST